MDLTPAEAAEVLALQQRYRADGRLQRKQMLLSAIPRWSAFVEQIEAGYPHGIEEYCASLDGRLTIQDLLDGASRPLAARIETVVRPLDARFMEATEGTAEPVWREESWWGWRVPTKRSEMFDRQVAPYLRSS